MPMISQASIEELRSRVNIYDLVSQYVSLKKSGSQYKGLSPFTTEKTPSFYVYPDKGFYYCFSTSQGGDLFKFVQVKENLSFPEAVEFIANRFSIKLEYETGSGGKKERSIRMQIFEMHEDAAKWYSDQFFSDTPEAEWVREYWTRERGFTLGQARELRIGYAPVNDETLKKLFLSKKYSPEAMVDSGIFSVRNGYPRDFYPRFKGRMMIPISDISGRVIAFTARKTRYTPDIPSEEGKYVNSRDTAIFSKKHVVFNIDKAKDDARRLGYFIVVEGQLDAIRMYCSGFKNTVATQGTSAGKDHFSQMMRFAKKVVLLFDGDSAGRRAALKTIGTCLETGIYPYVAALPDGEDPDSFIKSRGENAMRELIENGRKTAPSFAASVILDEDSNGDPSRKRAAIEELFSIVDKADYQVVKDDYLREISSVLHVDYLSLLGDYRAWKARSVSPAKYAAAASMGKFSGRSNQGMLTNSVFDALLVCLNHENVAEAMSGVIRDEWIQGNTPECVVFKKLMTLYREGVGFDIGNAAQLFDDDVELNLIYGIYAKEKFPIDNPVELANNCIRKIYRKYIEGEMGILERELSEADKKGSDKRLEILEKLKRMRKTLSKSPEILETVE